MLARLATKNISILYEKNFKKKPQEKAGGLEVIVHGDDINKALRIFKKKILKAGILNLAHDKQFFTKKSEKKRLAKSAGRQRWLKKLRETPGPHQMKNNYHHQNNYLIRLSLVGLVNS